MFGNIGIGGGVGQITQNKATPVTFKDQEDYVYKLLDDLDPGVLALLYKMLYARGYRIGTVEPQIRKLKQSLAAPSS
jgi:hypothetical protein